jgi:hypothetical protein
MLANTSGFQRIMSLIMVSTVNWCEFTPFTQGFTSIKITFNNKGMVNEEKESTSYLDRELNINEAQVAKYQALRRIDAVLNHELSHAYHDMIGYKPEPKAWLPNASIMNSTQVNFIGENFPMLVPKKMVPIVNKIENAVIASGNDLSSGKQFIQNIIKNAIRFGFGNVLFNSESELDILWTAETIAKCIYLYSFVLPPDDNTTPKSDIVWGTSEEQIVMRGYNIFLLNNKIFVVEDRQNENSYAVRTDGTHGMNSIEVGKHYRYHTLTIKMGYESRLTQACNELGIKNLLTTLVTLLSEPEVEEIFKPSGTKYTSLVSSYKSSEPVDYPLLDYYPSLDYYTSGKRHICSYDTAEELENDIDNGRVDLATINSIGKSGFTPLVKAIIDQKESLFVKLLKNNANPFIGGYSSALAKGIKEKDCDAVQLLLANYVGQPSQKDVYGILTRLIEIFDMQDVGDGDIEAEKLNNKEIYSIVFPRIKTIINDDSFFQNYDICTILQECITFYNFNEKTKSDELLALIHFLLRPRKLILCKNFVDNNALIVEALKKKKWRTCRRCNHRKWDKTTKRLLLEMEQST